MATTKNERGLVKQVLSEKIKDQLLEDLLNNKFKAGDRIVESTIAKEFNVSGAPVREAIKGLVEMGLLESQPYKGITVKSFSKEDLWEINTVRIALESLSASIAAEKITANQIKQLEEILDKMVKAAQSGDIIKRSKYNNQFHEAIIHASGHKLIERLSRNMRFSSWSATSGIMSSLDSVEIAKRHRLIIDALKRKDSKKAEQIMRDHIEASSKNLYDNLEDSK